MTGLMAEEACATAGAWQQATKRNLLKATWHWATGAASARAVSNRQSSAFLSA